jgi:DNA mismatch repair protein MutS
MSGQTPMMRQWAQIKRAQPDAIVLFRLGDFYEAFNEDAQALSEICDVVLTSRPVKKGQRAPMAGVPYHAVDGYIAQMVRAGRKVAIVEQMGEENSPEKRARMSQQASAPRQKSGAERSGSDEGGPEPGDAERGISGRSDAGQGGSQQKGSQQKGSKQSGLPPAERKTASRSGIMEREVVRVVTPGTLVEGDLLDARAPNHLAGLVQVNGRFGLAHADISTGRFQTTEFEGAAAERKLIDALARLAPAELIHPAAEGEAETEFLARLAASLDALGLSTAFMPYARWRFDAENARRSLLDHFGTTSLVAYGCEDRALAATAAGAVLAYVSETARGALRQITGLSTYAGDSFMQLDAATRRNLELTGTLRGDKRKGSLLWVLDQSRSPMGARRLRAWLDQPLLDLAKIGGRHDAVGELLVGRRARAELREQLGRVGDLERLINRLLAGYAGPRELRRIADGLAELPGVAATLRGLVGPSGSQRACTDDLPARPKAGGHVDHVAVGDGTAVGGTAVDGTAVDGEFVAGILGGLCQQDVEGLATLIRETLADEPPASPGVAGIIRPGHSADLDAIHASVADARSWIAGLEAIERERTGIKGLKVGFNKVFGYYLQAPKSAADQVPDDYHRKQTLSTGERYITPELKSRESEVLHAEERIIALERELYAELCASLTDAAGLMLEAARDLGRLDALVALAESADLGGYTRPELDDSRSLDIRAGRHPVVERLRPGFVPNDLLIESGHIVLLTGPNMAGKSTVGRQVALIALMAQIGSFVPADYARLGLVDRIFTRIGAQDEIAAGQSTFMVEMVETAGILNHASPRSLIVLDELGRGTSTYDGMSIAWAVIEHIHNDPRLGARTLFATHYHELTSLAEILPRITNLHLAVAETETGIAFLHSLRPGAADRSYGIHVAELAGMPKPVLARAWQILARLEDDGKVPMEAAVARPKAAPNAQLEFFAPAPSSHPVLDRLREMDPNALSPLEALSLLYELRRAAEEG